MLLHRCKDAKTSLHPAGIIVTDVVHDHLGQFLFAGKASAIVAFSFQNSPEALHRAVINTMGDAGHALRHTGLLQLAVKIPAGILCQRHFKMSIFAEMGCRFLQGSIQVLYSLIHHITCRFEARQALIYQLASGLTGENGKYNYSKAVHLYPPFFDIFCSPKNYKTASELTY